MWAIPNWVGSRDGIIENCHDLDQDDTIGYFCRILAGAWTDWRADMEVQKSDTVASMGRLYLVRAESDGTVFRSQTQSKRKRGGEVLDGIRWEVVQNDVTYTAGVRNVIFRESFSGRRAPPFSSISTTTVTAALLTPARWCYYSSRTSQNTPSLISETRHHAISPGVKGQAQLANFQ